MYVKPSYSIHFHFEPLPKNHYANVYGLKSLEQLMKVVNVLASNTNVNKLWWSKQWKVTKMSRWVREEHHVR